MRTRIQKYIRNMSLSRKIFSILLLALIPVTLVSFFGASWITSSYSDLLYDSIAAQLSSSAREISKQLQDVESLSYMVYSHDTVQNGLATIRNSTNNMQRTDANASLRSLLIDYSQNYRSSHVAYINLFSDNFSVSGNSYAATVTSDKTFEEARAAARNAEGTIVWYSTSDDPGHLYLSREIRRIQNLSLSSLGEEVICIDIDSMVQDATQFDQQYEQAQYLILQNDQILYSTEDLDDTKSLKLYRNIDGKYQILKVGVHTYFAVAGKIPRYEWDYLCLVPFDSVMSTLNGAHALFLVLLFLCTTVVVMLALTLISSLDRHFHNLILKMDAIGDGTSYDPSVATYDYSDRTDEIGVLHQQFDRMATRIHNLIQINYINELLKKEAQLKALENQINPHFLYNTLESVNWRAKALGAEDISTMVQSLAALLRVTLSHSDTIFTLRQELDLVKSYMSIQEYRFEDRLVFSSHVPDEFLNVHIVKLTIQPLVENAIHYGLEENTETCEITLSARQTPDGKTQILVTNTGSTFEDDLLEKLKSGEISPHGHGIGLLNIDKRLKLTYGEEYGLTLYNEEECAVAAITIPTERSEESC